MKERKKESLRPEAWIEEAPTVGTKLGGLPEPKDKENKAHTTPMQTHPRKPRKKDLTSATGEGDQRTVYPQPLVPENRDKSSRHQTDQNPTAVNTVRGSSQSSCKQSSPTSDSCMGKCQVLAWVRSSPTTHARLPAWPLKTSAMHRRLSPRELPRR